MVSNYHFIIAVALTIFVTISQAKKVHYIHWNRANPMFRLDNTDHVVDINVGNLPWEYDQVNIICPVTKSGVRYPESHVVYSVSREEYESCRVTNPKPKIVAVCSKPHQLLYFTITFRSFTPTPGGLEFHPGQDYYFISTSSPEDLHRRVGGGCATHNMRMVFRVAENGLQNIVEEEEVGIPQVSNNLEMAAPAVPIFKPTLETTIPTTEEPRRRFQLNPKAPYSRSKYYMYHPRDLFEDNTIESINEIDTYSSNDIWRKNEALRYTSGGQTVLGHQVVTMLLVCIGVKFLV